MFAKITAISLMGKDRVRGSEHLQTFSAAQELPVDLRELFQYLFRLPVVLQVLFYFLLEIRRDIIHLRPSLGIAHRQVILGAVAWSVRALAPGFAAALVPLHKRAPKDRLATAEACGGWLSVFAGGLSLTSLSDHLYTWSDSTLSSDIVKSFFIDSIMCS